MKRVIVLALAAMAVGTSAAAQIPRARHLPPITADVSRSAGGYIYYNRPGASWADHEAAVRQCLEVGAATIRFEAPGRYGSSAGIGAAAGGAGLLGVLAAVAVGAAADASVEANENRRMLVNVENCMLVRGWSAVQLPEDEGRALSRLEPAELATRLGPMVGAYPVQGTVVRRYMNEVAANQARLNTQALVDRRSLSLQAVSTSASVTEAAGENTAQAAARQGAPPAAKPGPDLAAHDQLRPVTTGRQLAARPEGTAVIVVRLTGLDRSEGLSFEQLPTTPNANVGAFTVGLGASGSPNETWAAFVVQPGRWRIWSVNRGRVSTDFCLSAPAFEVAAGDVVYAGTFGFDVAPFGPALDPQPAQTWLTTLSPSAAGSLRPASYSNGWTTGCFGNYVYGLDVPGAPSRPAQDGGSQATPVPSASEGGA